MLSNIHFVKFFIRFTHYSLNDFYKNDLSLPLYCIY